MKDFVENFTLSTFLRHLFCGVVFLVAYQRATGEFSDVLKEGKESPILLLSGLAVTCGVLIYAVEITLINSTFHALRHRFIRKSQYPLWTLTGLETVEKRWKAAADPSDEPKYFQKKLNEGADYVHLQLSCSLAIALGSLIGILHNEKAGEPAWDLIIAGGVLLFSAVVADVRRHSLQSYLFR